MATGVTPAPRSTFVVPWTKCVFFASKVTTKLSDHCGPEVGFTVETAGAIGDVPVWLGCATRWLAGEVAEFPVPPGAGAVVTFGKAPATAPRSTRRNRS